MTKLHNVRKLQRFCKFKCQKWLKYVVCIGSNLQKIKREFYAKVNEVKKDIHTLEDLLKFTYDNDLTDWSSPHINGWQTDWVSRVAVRELAKEICGIELGE